jgi:hypothetical protein
VQPCEQREAIIHLKEQIDQAVTDIRSVQILALKLERVDTIVTRIDSKIEKLQTITSISQVDIAKLKIKTAIWGSVGGAIFGAIFATLISLIIKKAI